jgi:hypothetical protein
MRRRIHAYMRRRSALSLQALRAQNEEEDTCTYEEEERLVLASTARTK